MEVKHSKTKGVLFCLRQPRLIYKKQDDGAGGGGGGGEALTPSNLGKRFRLNSSPSVLRGS